MAGGWLIKLAAYTSAFKVTLSALTVHSLYPSQASHLLESSDTTTSPEHKSPEAGLKTAVTYDAGRRSKRSLLTPFSSLNDQKIRAATRSFSDSETSAKKEVFHSVVDIKNDDTKYDTRNFEGSTQVRQDGASNSRNDDVAKIGRGKLSPADESAARIFAGTSFGERGSFHSCSAG